MYLIENMKLINNKKNIEEIKDLNSNFINTLLLINNDNILVRIEKFNRFEEILQNISLQNINKDTYLILCDLLIKKIKKNDIPLRNIVAKINSTKFNNEIKNLPKNKILKWLFEL